MRSFIRRGLLAACCAILGTTGALAQGVGINGTGASADASAMLDVASTMKGFLPPRMTAVQRAAIVSPATGLLVYQSDGTVGLYYNAGTPASPSWQAVGSGAAGQWSTSGADLYYAAGKVGIGTPPGPAGLTIVDPTNGLRVVASVTGGAVASFGSTGRFEVDAPFIPGGRVEVLENGNVGIGNTAPANPLSFASMTGKKISLWHSGGNTDYGFGTAANRLEVYGGGANADVALGYDNAGTFVEKLAVKPTGVIAVSGSPGSAGQVLMSNGSGAPAAWSSPVTILQAASTGSAAIATTHFFAMVPGLNLSFTVPAQGANVLVQYTVQTTLSGCVVCTGTSIAVFIVIDGAGLNANSAPVGGASTLVPAGVEVQSVSGSQVLTGLSAGVHSVSVVALDTGGQGVSVGDLATGAGYGGGLLRSILIAQVIPN